MGTFLGLTTQQWKRLFYVRWDDVIVYTILFLVFETLLTFI